MNVRLAVTFCLCVTLLLLTVTGCFRGDDDRGSPPDPGSIPVVEAAGPIRTVSAENWLKFAVVDPPATPGWIAVPPKQNHKAFHSRQNPAALGMLPPEACLACHAEIVTSFQQTAHARTAQIPSRDSILGDLQAPKNRLETGYGGFHFEMVERQGKFWQDVFLSNESSTPDLSVSVEYVIGSGNHGQSYVHREGDQLCQMHVSYYSEFDRWTNSPGPYRDGTADFARPVTSRCLDCHATWFAHESRSVNRFDLDGAIPGVTCVRCHGPAAQHVQYHELQPDEGEAHFIVNPGVLDRDRLQEVCAQCHSGGGELRRAAFSFVPGERLSDYLDIDLTATSENNDDPHSANQLGRLGRSACFQRSNELSCVTCHDPHRHERGNTALFSSRCHQCHNVKDCGAESRLGIAIEKRCIECHMPSRRDAEVATETDSQTLLPLLRDHLIGIWPDVSDRVEKSMQKSQRGPDSDSKEQ